MSRLNSSPILIIAVLLLNLCCYTEKKSSAQSQKMTAESLSAALSENKGMNKSDTAESPFSISIEGYKATPLGKAVYDNDTAKILELIGSGASIEKCITDETYIYDILYAAFVFNKIDIVHYVLRNSLYVDVNATYTEEAETPLTLACSLPDSNAAIEIARKLIESGAEVDGGGDSGGEQTKYPIIIAVSRNSYSLTKLLVDNGADKNVMNSQGETPLSIAQNNGNNEIASLFGGS